MDGPGEEGGGYVGRLSREPVTPRVCTIGVFNQAREDLLGQIGDANQNADGNQIKQRNNPMQDKPAPNGVGQAPAWPCAVNATLSTKEIFEKESA